MWASKLVPSYWEVRRLPEQSGITVTHIRRTQPSCNLDLQVASYLILAVTISNQFEFFGGNTGWRSEYI
jgi:hypothetical protein